VGVKGKADIIDTIVQKRLQLYGHVKRIPQDRIPKLIVDWIPGERRKRGRPRKTWKEGVQAAMTTRNLEPDQWRNREEWSLVFGRRRQLLKNRTDRYKFRNSPGPSSGGTTVFMRHYLVCRMKFHPAYQTVSYTE